jgi:integrase
VITFFIPEHVARKGPAGRTHYRSILKYIVKPDSGDRIIKQFAAHTEAPQPGLPEWPYLGALDLRSIKAEDVRKLTSVALEYGYSPQTVKHIRNVLGAILSHAIERREFSGPNPVHCVVLPPVVPQIQNLSVAQVRSILGELRYPEREIALITIATGMSIAEICALQWKYVNLNARAAIIDGEVIPASCILVKYYWNAKGLVPQSSARVRRVQIPEALLTMLRQLKQQESVLHGDDFVLTSASGKPVSPANARDLILKPIGRRVRIPRLSWQMIKRSHGTLLGALRHQLCDDLVRMAH